MRDLVNFACVVQFGKQCLSCNDLLEYCLWICIFGNFTVGEWEKYGVGRSFSFKCFSSSYGKCISVV